MQNIDPSFYIRLYRSMLRIRRVEEEVARLYPTDIIKSPVHLSIGQEATAVGVCEALRRDDVIFGTYRNHAVYLAKGGDLNKMVAELCGKFSGGGKGKAGSMHLIDPAAGVLGASAIVGTSIPNAVGYALSLKIKKKDSIALTYFGDGAVDEGCFYESLNYAALERLPVLFVCENNGYAVYSRQLDRQPQSNIAERARAIGVNSIRIEDNDVLAIYEKASAVIEAMRHGHGGPCLLECMTYRWREHVGPQEDYDGIRRNKAEADLWIAKDQIPRIAGMIGADQVAKIETEVRKEIDAAFEFAKASPFPPDEELLTDVFKES